MIRLSNKPEHQTKIQYVDRDIVRQVHAKAPDAIIQYIDREIPVIIEKKVEVPVIHMVESSVSLETLEKMDKQITNQEKISRSIAAELEMQRRALVAIKAQRDIDRSRRLMLIKRMKKEHDEHKKIAKHLRWTIAASLALSILVLIIKL